MRVTNSKYVGVTIGSQVVSWVRRWVSNPQLRAKLRYSVENFPIALHFQNQC